MARETAHSMLRRCRGWDYRAPAIYMITLTLADRRSCALGRLVDDGARPPRVEPSPLGAAVLAHWKRMGEFTPGVEPLFGIVMPDHFHGILRVAQYLEKPLGNAIGGFKGGTTGIYRKLALPAQDKGPGCASADSAAFSSAGGGESRKLALPAQDKGPRFASADPAAFSSAGGGESRKLALPAQDKGPGCASADSAAFSSAGGGESRKLALPAQDKGPRFASADPAAFSSAGGGESRKLALPAQDKGPRFASADPAAFSSAGGGESRKLALPAQDKGPGCASADPAAFSSAGGGESLPAHDRRSNGASADPAPCPVLGAQAPSLWSPGFNDRILLHAGQLAAMFDYLRDNPRRLAVRRRNPDLFRVLRDLPLDLGFPAHFAAVGNDALLRAPVLLQVQCSRSLLPGGREFEELRAGFIAAAQHGAVLVSPCISRGEREIVRSALACGGAAIALKNKGFPDVYKPDGRLFDRCADGKLLLLAPAAWPYTPAEKPMTRLDACALNRIAQLISRDGAAAIDYRGMTPANVDALARAACTRRGGQSVLR